MHAWNKTATNFMKENYRIFKKTQKYTSNSRLSIALNTRQIKWTKHKKGGRRSYGYILKSTF